MTWQYSPFTIPLLLGSVLVALLALIIWRRSRAAGVSIGVLLTLLGAGTLAATGLERAGGDLDTLVFWNQVQHIFLRLMPTLWLLLVIQSQGYGRWLNRSRLALLSIVPVVNLILVLANGPHGLIWARYTLETVDSTLILHHEPGPLGWPFTLYHFGLMGVGLYLTVRTILQPDHPRRRQARLLFIVVIPPLVIGTLAGLDIAFFPVYYLASLAALLGIFLLVWVARNLSRNVIPAARDMVMDSLSDAVIVLDGGNRIIDLNPAARRLLGRPGQVVIGQPLAALWPEAARLEPEMQTAAVVSKELSLDRVGEPHTFDAHISPLFDRLGVLASRVIVLHDITERKSLEQILRLFNSRLETYVVERTIELEGERAQLQAIIDSMGEGMIYTEGLDACRVNQALADMTGYSVAELSGSTDDLLKLLPDRSTFQVLLDQAGQTLADGGIWQGEVRLRRRDGSLFEAGLTVAPVEGRSDPQATVTLVRDISAQKALQAQKDLFIANASHQLRTPMTNIMTRLYLARHQPERLEEHLRVLEETAEQMTDLIGQMLDTSYFEQQAIRLRREEVILQDLLASVLTDQIPKTLRKHIRLVYDLSAGVLRAEVDPWRLRDALSHLITYAVNYSPDNGEICLRLMGNATHAVITIQDSSPGTPWEMLPHLFEPFFKAMEGSVQTTGMELAIARAIVEAHGGTLTATSELGHGNTFALRLPLCTG